MGQRRTLEEMVGLFERRRGCDSLHLAPATTHHFGAVVMDKSELEERCVGEGRSKIVLTACYDRYQVAEFLRKRPKDPRDKRYQSAPQSQKRVPRIRNNPPALFLFETKTIITTHPIQPQSVRILPFP